MSSTTVLFSPSSSLYLAKPSPITKGRTAVAAVRLAATQGLLAGRIPGLAEPEENDRLENIPQARRQVRRPRSWLEPHHPLYSFRVPDGWDEVPVSIADLGGTEIDLRFANPKEGRLFVIVAPVRRFADNLDDATIEKIGNPEKVINAFGPEVIGENVEGKVLSSVTAEHSGRTYYQFELEPPHVFITATAAGNRLYLFSVTASGRTIVPNHRNLVHSIGIFFALNIGCDYFLLAGLQWKRQYKDLKQIAESFRVV
ncbi:hypothetical protein U9M48_035047 [Paspalum notatum var. saurae]|uniref:PsbP C-terminal domain-containing protein n=1 Tax=Paspalum notatum var. saurae TaxID=547442 RepID=A0AAQ3UAV8_PASNO